MGLYEVYHPWIFQGRKKNHSYFEGWYFKMAAQYSGEQDADVIALIPGVALSDTEERHAFIQVISSSEGRSWYVPFAYEEFQAARKSLDVHIGGNTFTYNQIMVDIDFEDLRIKGEVLHTGQRSFPVTLRSPGIMGWYAYVPFMECFHGVVSMFHRLEGSLSLNGRETSFSGGTGYIEKDWGTSFPEAWIWMQSSAFPTGNASCMLSIARIPFLGRVFTGFLGFVLYEDELIRFGTYTGAEIVSLETTEDFAHVIIGHKKRLLEFRAVLGAASRLTAPRQGNMDRIILESIQGRITVTVKTREESVVFSETGFMAGIELSEAASLKKPGS
jgi:tocopherol cyclase